MLVVADETPFRICRERGLAGAAQPEEYGRVAIPPHIRRTMHGHDGLLREQVIQKGEHRLLDFAGVTRAPDENQALREIEEDKGFRVGPVLLGVGREIGERNDSEVRRVLAGPGGFALDEQVPGENALPGQFRDNPDPDLIIGIGACQAILDIQLPSPHVGLHPLVD